MRRRAGEKIMKKILLSALGLVAIAAPAIAADLPARTYRAPPPVPVVVYDWTGFYIGGNAGYGWSRNCWGDFGTSVIPEGCVSRSGGMAGGQGGYRWQMGQV